VVVAGQQLVNGAGGIRQQRGTPPLQTLVLWIITGDVPGGARTRAHLTGLQSCTIARVCLTQTCKAACMGFAVVVHATCKCTSWLTLLLVVGLQVSLEQGQFMSVLVKAAGVKMPNMLAQDSVHVYAVFSQATCCGLHKLHPQARTVCCCVCAGVPRARAVHVSTREAVGGETRY
jgi:hypothetical protein